MYFGINRNSHKSSLDWIRDLFQLTKLESDFGTKSLVEFKVAFYLLFRVELFIRRYAPLTVRQVYFIPRTFWKLIKEVETRTK